MLKRVMDELAGPTYSLMVEKAESPAPHEREVDDYISASITPVDLAQRGVEDAVEEHDLERSWSVAYEE